MVFLTEGTRALRDTVVYLRTAVSMSRSANAFKDLDSRIEKLETYLDNLNQTQQMAQHEEGVDEYLNAIGEMLIEVEDLLEAAKRRKKKGMTY